MVGSTRSVPALILVALLLAVGASEGAPDSREVVQASEILAKIERGEPVEYDGVIVEGDLDLNELDLPTEHVERTKTGSWIFRLTDEVKVVKSPINITNSEIRGDASFGNAVFREQVDFDSTNFTGSAWFLGSNFREEAIFWYAVFSGGDAVFGITEFSGGDADFQNAKFSGGGADFDRAEFSGGDANFNGADFSGGSADFSYAEFSGGDALFQNAKFSDEGAYFSFADFTGGEVNFFGAEFSNAYFNEAVFAGGYSDFKYTVFSGERTSFWDAKFTGGNVRFQNAKFSGGYADFEGAKFSGGVADFAWAEFSGGDADFRGVEFSGGDAEFDGADFTGGDANFGGVEFSGGDAQFDGAQFSDDRNSMMDFMDTSFYGNASFVDAQFTQYADFRETRFNGSLDLTHSRFDRLEIEWDSIKDHLICDETVYVALVKNFNDLARTDDADDCYYEYRRESQRDKPFGLSKISDWIAWISYGYGVRWQHTIGLSLVMIFLFGLIFKLGRGIQKSTYPCQQASQNISLSDTLYFSALAFVSQPPYNWGPRDGSWWKYVVLAENILGWIFLTLFVITLT